MANVYDAAGDAVTPNAYDAAERRFHYDGLEPEDLSSGSLHCGKRGLSPPNSTSSDGPLRTASVNKVSDMIKLKQQAGLYWTGDHVFSIKKSHNTVNTQNFAPI